MITEKQVIEYMAELAKYLCEQGEPSTLIEVELGPLKMRFEAWTDGSDEE